MRLLTPRSRISGVYRLGRLILVIGLCCGIISPLAQAASPETYNQLRLLMEALHEVKSKYVQEEKDTTLIYGAIRGLVKSLDPGSSFLTPAEYQEMLAGKKAAEGEIGVELTIKDKILTVLAPLEGGPAWQAGIIAGDHILKVNEQSVGKLSPMEAAKRLQGPPGSTVKLQLLRNGMIKPLDVTLTLAKLSPNSLTQQTLEDHYVYLRLKYFTDQTAQDMAQILKNLPKQRPAVKGLILDLRNNARGTLEQAVAVASTFVGNSLIFYTKGRQVEQLKPYYGQESLRVWRENLPIIILVDEGTAKAAEILAAALKDNKRALLLGTKTFGSCSVSKAVPLKDGSALIITVAYCYTPGGRQIQEKGLTPDVKETARKSPDRTDIQVTTKLEKPKEMNTVQDLLKDPLIAQALQLLKQGGGPRAKQLSVQLETGAGR